MKILHVITTLDIGGAERLMVDLLPLLQQDGNQVDLLLFNGVNTPFKQELIKKGIHIHQLSCWKGIKHHYEVYNPLNIFRLKKYLDNYDIIHTHNTACQYYVALASTFCKRPILVTTEHSTNNRRRSWKLFKRIDELMYGKYAAIVCISQQASTNLIDYLGSPNKIHTILNGVDVGRFFKPLKDVSKNKEFLISMIAAFRKEKDHETVLKAMALLPSNYYLQLAGRDFDKKVPLLKQMCHDLGIENRVAFLGARSDIPNLLEKGDIALLSSVWEGLSLSSIEGMASGRPFIASDVDGLHEMVGGAGVLFPQGDATELAKKIQWLCEHPEEYREVAKRCQERAKLYDITVMAENYSNLYKSIV